MSSNNKPTSEQAPAKLAPELQQILLVTARKTVEYGLAQHRLPTIDYREYPLPLQHQGASFVTLSIDGELRGCIGSLEAQRPLIEDISRNAYAAAFQDPRFPPLSKAECPLLHIHISILSPPVAMAFSSEADLLQQLQPHVDGLILESRDGHRGTFLPTVWQSLPDPRVFLRQLKLKAGLSADYWSDNLQVYHYTTLSFGEDRGHT